ncbi:MAG TPA: histidine--tRNA ligase [Cyclobacteriaceae bacterium]|nr:histidine--tRNA ligase [Cyclobacteriaceae bacterium]
MSIPKPTIPKGTRDFGPLQMARRNYIFDIIKKTFRLFGYQQLETPAMENLTTLTGKYGEEGDMLLYKILNSGNFLKNVSTEDLESGPGQVLPKLAEKGLRYDLTVPFARYVVMNQNGITFPFRRFQIQPVWRADRPQKGRYREFYQCDADVVGTQSLVCEAEYLLMIKRVFSELKIPDYRININNRKILTGFAQIIGEPGREGELCVAIDKMDKIGWDKVREELGQRGFSDIAVQKLVPIVGLGEGNQERISFLKDFLSESPIGLTGLRELEKVMQLLTGLGDNGAAVTFNPMLARGLSYYTGAIFELQVNNVSIGSLGGGGRYDNLTGVFGLKDVSGVGFSFGVDRIYDVLEELGLFPEEQAEGTRVMVGHFDEEGIKHGLAALSAIREAGIAAEIYPDEAKLKKQFNYADKKNIPYVLMVGPEEIAQGKFTLRNMKTGEQKMIPLAEVIAILSAG